MFRWKGIILLLVLIGIFVILSLIFTDRWMENKIENLGSSVAGAKVEVDNLDFSFTALKFRWDRIQVTDRKNTMKNLVETGVCEFDMEFWPLLSKKVIIENFTIADFRTNTDRQTDGKIDLPAEKVSKEPGFIEKTASRLTDQVSSNAADQFSSYQQKVNVDSIMALLQIQSVPKISALQQDLTQSYDTWSKNLSQLNYDSDFRKLDAQLKAIDVNKIKTADEVQSALKSADQLKKSLDSLNKAIKTTRSNLTTDLGAARQQSALRNDLRALGSPRSAAICRRLPRKTR